MGALLRRVRDRATWLRHTYPFQLAHGPLCDRYRGDAVRVAHVFVCRSCLMLYAALALSTGLLLLWAPATSVLAWMLPLVATIVLGLSWPPLYRTLPRVARDLIRAGAGLLAALVLRALLSGAWWLGGSWALLLSLAYVAFAAKRRAARKTLCDGCPELGQPGVCSGYAQQAAYIRRHEEVMAARASVAIGARLAARAARPRP